MVGERADETKEIRNEVLHRTAKKKNLCREDKTRDTTVSDVKICWVCHSSENGDNSDAWINPCKCKGSVKWCHQTCLRPWIQYKIDNRRAVQCDICNYRYKIRYPPTPANTNVYYSHCFAWFVVLSTLWVCIPPKFTAFRYGDRELIVRAGPPFHWVLGFMIAIRFGPRVPFQYKLFSACMELTIGWPYMIVLLWSVVALLLTWAAMVVCLGPVAEIWIDYRDLMKKTKKMQIRAHEDR